MKNSKGKGSAFEREISKRLTLWLTGQDKELAFWRSSNSGGTFTVNKGATKEMSGDIAGITPEGIEIAKRINFEAKTGYADASFDLHLKGNKGDTLKSFWEQSTRDAAMTGKQPMVIFRKKRMPNVWCGVSEKLFNTFKGLKEFRHICLSWGKDGNVPSVIFMNFEDFLSTVSPEELLKAL